MGKACCDQELYDRNCNQQLQLDTSNLNTSSFLSYHVVAKAPQKTQSVVGVLMS